MKCFIVLSALMAVAMAKPHAVVAPLAYAHVVPGAPIGPDGRVVDTPEVAVAKAANAAAHINEKVTLAREASKNYAAYSGVVPAAAYSTYATAPVLAAAYSAAPVVSAYSAAPVVSAYSAPALAYGKVYSGYAPAVGAYSYGAPLSLDGRVVDTPEVAVAKAAHFAAHAEAKARLGYAGHYAYAAPAVSVW